MIIAKSIQSSLGVDGCLNKECLLHNRHCGLMSYCWCWYFQQDGNLNDDTWIGYMDDHELNFYRIC